MIKRAKNRLVLMLLAVLLLVGALLLLALRNWQTHTETTIVLQTFRSQVFLINSIVSDYPLSDHNQFSSRLNQTLVNAGIQRILIVDKNGHILQSAPDTWIDQSIGDVVTQWFSTVNGFEQVPVERPLLIRDGVRMHAFQRLYMPTEKWPNDIVLYIEMDVSLLMGSVPPVWQSFFWWALAVLFLVFVLARWYVQRAIVTPLEEFSRSINNYVEHESLPLRADRQAFVELAGLEQSVIHLVNRLRVKSNALADQGHYIHEKLDELDRIIRCAGVATWDWDMLARQMRFNVQWSHMLGLPLDPVEGTEALWRERVHPDDQFIISRALAAHFEHHEHNYHCEYRMRHHLGHWVWVLDTGEVYERDAFGNPLKAAGIQIDISERKRLEANVSQTTARLLAVFNQSYTGIAVFDLGNTRLLNCNQRFADLLQTNTDNIVGHSLDGLLALKSGRDPVTRFTSCEWPLQQTPSTTTEWEEECRCHDGSWIWLHITASVCRIGVDDGIIVLMAQSIQDRKHIEHLRELQRIELEQSQLRFDTMLSSMQEGVVLQTPDGRVLEVNDIAPRLLGVEAVDLLSSTPSDRPWRYITRDGRVLSIEERPPARCVTTCEAQRNVVMGIQHAALKRVIWLNVNSSPVFDQEHHVIYTVTTFSDITERLENETRLQETSARLQALMDHAPDVILGVDATQTILYASAAAERLFGYTPMELVGQKIDVLLPERIMGTHSKLANDYLQGSDNNSKHVMINSRLVEARAKSGQLVHVEITLSRAVTAQGVLATAVIRDVTQHRQLQAHVSRLSHAIEQSPIKYIIFDLNGIIEYINTACVSQGHYEAGELIGRNVFELYSPLTDRAQLKTLVDSLIQRHTWKGELSFIHRDGSISVDRTTIAPLRDNEGNVTHFISMQEDITEQIRVNRELDEYRNGLEKMVIARTIELTDAKQKAEAATLAKSSFLANMSHEIRTPMNAITGFAQLLRQEELTKKQADYVGKIVFAAEHLLHIINDVLDLSKIEAGKVALQMDTFDVKRFASEMLDMVRSRAEIKNLKLSLSVADDVPETINCDRMRLGQVLLNLLSNATKFTDRGEVSLHIVLHSKQRLRIEVRDTGIGISATSQARLFQAFEQADVSTTRRFGGTGLGLSICKNLVQLMGGDIGLDSQVGEGSTFWLELPFQTVSREQVRLQQKPSSAPTASHKQYPNARVLLAEDDKLNQELVLILLAQHGIQVSVANDGVEALAFAREHDFDVILMDIQMPVMDGMACAKDIRASSRNRHTPIVALTANVFDEERIKYEQAGITEVMAKPLDMQKLAALLARWLSADSIAESLPPVPTQASVLLTQISGDDAAKRHEQALLQRLRECDEFVLDKALQNVGQRIDLLVSLCKGFCSSHADTVNLIRTLLESNQIGHAARLAHSLKGAALAIAAQPLAAAAAQLEQQLNSEHHDDVAISTALQLLHWRMDNCLSVLRTTSGVSATQTEVSASTIS